MRNLPVISRGLLSLALTLTLLTCISSSLFAQQDSTRFSREDEMPPKRVFWGANLGLLIGTYTNVGVAPYIGYGLTPSTDIGAGPFLQYSAYRRNGYASYGARAFLRQRVVSNFFAQAEYEYMNTEDPEEIVLEPDSQERIDVSSLFLGAGYYGGIGRRTRMHFAILFDVLENDYKPYDNPVIRLGFSRYF